MFHLKSKNCYQYAKIYLQRAVKEQTFSQVFTEFSVIGGSRI